MEVERRIRVIDLILMKSTLKHLKSFSENVLRCNFTFVTGWRGKVYVDRHNVEDYLPTELRGITVLSLFYLCEEDCVVLTEDQYKDYKRTMERYG